MRTYFPRLGGGCNRVEIGVYPFQIITSLRWLELAIMLTRVMSFTGPNKPLIRVNNLSNSVTRTMSFYGRRLLIQCLLGP